MSHPINDYWYPVGLLSGIDASRATLLLGANITVGCTGGVFWVKDVVGNALPTVERFGHL